ncbi:crotonobetaine/carnitine-CoA ligase [Rhodoligotrophos appendicifer]|uniref:AMP-binding protein n=1 Tax=Rhodoligotrophos appendicifer TaxID=987056 RepID=UPI00117CB81C|nr:AMP-binding protein [Rhodoligotrophos appendicifer]
MTSFAMGERTIVHVLREACRAHPDKAWLRSDAGDMSYAAMETLSNRLAHGLVNAGVQPGDTLLVMMPDSAEQIAIWIACAKLGIIEVPVNTAYRGEFLAHIMNDCGAKSAIIGAGFAERLVDIRDRLQSLQQVYAFTVEGEDAVSAFRDVQGLRVAAFESLISGDEAEAGGLPPESQVMSIMYTSGTTGGSKGVMVSHAHAFEYAAGCAGVLEIHDQDVYYTAGLPLFHVAGKWGVIFGAALFGATAALPRQFSARKFWDDVRRFKVTATYLLGAMANFLQRQPPLPEDADNPLGKVLMCPLLPDVGEFAERFDVRIASAYGSTEVNAPLSMPLARHVADSQNVGKIRHDRFDVMVADENDMPVPPGTLGEILVRPKQPWITMLGYWNQPAQTVKMWRNLWLHSGDAGRYDEAGTFYFVDRIQDTIRRRGENISSMEVEGLLCQHPAIAECAVFPVSSIHTEHEVMAAIVLKPQETLSPEDLIRFAEPRMPHFMIPRFLEFAAELPKTPTGKVKKHILREAGRTSATWDRESAGITLKK